MAEIVHNPKARRDYQILDTFEAGIVLRGSEVKAIRAVPAGFVRVRRRFSSFIILLNVLL